MELPLKLIILLGFIHYNYASQHTHIIPIEGYDSGLKDLGQHVEIPETPVKVIKITKTIAVKIPVPYPVKVREKVPYPVHVAKPYPVPVPQIIKVPAHDSSHKHDEGTSGNNIHSSGNDGYAPSYQVQEGDSYSGGGVGGDSGGDYHQGNSFTNEYPSEGTSYDAPIHNYGGNGNSQLDDVSYDTNSYDQAIQDYLQKRNQNGGHNGGYSFH